MGGKKQIAEENVWDSSIWVKISGRMNTYRGCKKEKFYSFTLCHSLTFEILHTGSMPTLLL